MTEAAHPAATYALHQLVLREIVADIHPETRTSIRVTSKPGMTYRAVMHNSVPCRRYAITQDDLQFACNGDMEMR